MLCHGPSFHLTVGVRNNSSHGASISGLAPDNGRVFDVRLKRFAADTNASHEGAVCVFIGLVA
jgi:hypothetical protein